MFFLFMNRPLRDNDCNAVLTKFNDEIRAIVSQLSQENSNCIITGDTNINILQFNERTKFQEYFDILITNGLFCKITQPTRYYLNRNTATLIDHLLCKFIDSENCICSGILISDFWGPWIYERYSWRSILMCNLCWHITGGYTNVCSRHASSHLQSPGE